MHGFESTGVVLQKAEGLGSKGAWEHGRTTPLLPCSHAPQHRNLMKANDQPNEIKVGSSQNFVLARGIQQVGEYWVLIGEDGRQRLFAELTADPDRPDVRPIDAYRALLSSMQPGWTVRTLQIFWPDPLPRQAFYEQFEQWNTGSADNEHEGTQLLRQSLSLFLQESPLPFVRRTIMEFVLVSGAESLSWWEGISAAIRTYGVKVTLLSADEIQTLARWVFNPALDL